MPMPEWNQDSLVWRFAMTDDGPDFHDTPGFEPPDPWLHAIAAVARDLRCLRYGRDVQVSRLVWELAISDQYAVTSAGADQGSVGSTSATAYRWMRPTRRSQHGSPRPRKAS